MHLPPSVFQNVLPGKVAGSCPLLKMMSNYEETLQRDALADYRKAETSGAGDHGKILLPGGRGKETNVLDTHSSILSGGDF